MNVYIPSSGFATQGPCPTGFHVPLSSEWSGLKTIMDGLSLTTGDNWRINLHMPFAGYRERTAAIDVQGSRGHYWSSSPLRSDMPDYAMEFFLTSSIARTNGNLRARGFSIRCFKDSFTVPTSSWTIINGILGSAGIFWNQSEGLISITSDGTTGYTIQDKNLGATTVYNDGDTLSEANMGNMYQRGNNYGFPSTGTISKTSSTQVNASTYGPGNYYSSDTFITRDSSPYDWSSLQNDNLRGGTDGNVPVTTMKEVNNIYIGEVYSGPLRFTANTANSTVQLTKNGSPTEVTLETSTDGTTWTTYTFGSTITLSNIGDKVYFRNTSTTTTGFSTSTSNYYQFVMTGSIDADGNCNTLLKKDGLVNGLVGDYCYGKLFFNCSSLMKSPKLPATILTQYCYFCMFYMCGISEMPSLPATTLANYCYDSMFSSCSNLEKTSSLPATTLADYCYYNMFSGCTSLTTPPKLPATTLADYCYYSMFYGCTSLTAVPALPATSLATSCYQMMFINCSSLVELPKLSATTLPKQCYNNMFNGCSKIKLSTSQTGEYQTAYRIPTTGTGSEGSNSLYRMFYSIGSPFTGTPSINTTYYTSNTIV